MNKLILWLNYYNPNRVKVKKTLKKFNKDCFYLNNNRLKKKIGIKIKLIELERYCKKLSKKFLKRNEKSCINFRDNWSRWIVFGRTIIEKNILSTV